MNERTIGFRMGSLLPAGPALAANEEANETGRPERAPFLFRKPTDLTLILRRLES